MKSNKISKLSLVLLCLVCISLISNIFFSSTGAFFTDRIESKGSKISSAKLDFTVQYEKEDGTFTKITEGNSGDRILVVSDTLSMKFLDNVTVGIKLRITLKKDDKIIGKPVYKDLSKDSNTTCKLNISTVSGVFAVEVAYKYKDSIKRYNEYDNISEYARMYYFNKTTSTESSISSSPSAEPMQPSSPSDKSVSSSSPSAEPMQPSSPSDKSVSSPSPSAEPVQPSSPSDKSVSSPSPSAEPVQPSSPSDESVSSPSPSAEPVQPSSPSDELVSSPSPSAEPMQPSSPSDESVSSPEASVNNIWFLLYNYIKLNPSLMEGFFIRSLSNVGIWD